MIRPAAPSNIIIVDDADDARLEDYRGIRERDQRGVDGRPGLFVGEQLLIVEKMLRIVGMTKSVLTLTNHARQIAARAPSGVPIFAVEPAVMERVAGFRVHRGVLAIGHRPPPQRLTLDAAVPHDIDRITVLLCEDVNNMDNIGMLFRNAAAFGVDAVVLSPACHDPLYRKSLRVSIGYALTVPWARSTDWHGDLARLKSHWRMTLIGAATAARAMPLDSVVKCQRVGIVVGQEHRGLSEPTLELCDAVARIPMAAGVDSLNVATAAAVCLHRLSTGIRA